MTRRELGRLLVLGGAGWLWAGGCAPAPGGRQPRSAAQADPIERMLERLRAQHGLPGLAAAAVRGGKVVASGVAGFRRLSAADPIAPGDRFHIASCTKSMTATLAALFVQRGRLQWTTPLAEGLPALAATMRPEYRSATLEQLLAHEARIPAYTQFGPERAAQLRGLSGTPQEQRLAFLAEVLATEEPNAGTGEAGYSNAGYAAVGALVEHAAGSSWEELMRSELARPLGMTSLGFGYPATAAAPDQPRGHSVSEGQGVELPLDESRQLAPCLWPAGAVHGSIGDLALYAADHLNGLRGRRALLRPETYQRLHRPLQGGDRGFTLGWGIRPDPRWGRTHFGAGSGGWFFVRIAIVPEHDAAVVAAANSGEASEATKAVLAELLEQYAA